MPHSERLARFPRILELDDTRSEPVRALENAAADHRQSEGLQTALAQPDDRGRRVVGARWLADEPVTLHDPAAEFGVSPERVRQIESKAMQKNVDDLAPLIAA